MGKKVEELPQLKQFREWFEKRHEYAKEWKRKNGGKVVGYYCTYCPEEILYAAGVLPVRILGSHEPESITRPYLHDMYCPFCHDTLAQGLQGRYDYLDGVTLAQSCLHMRQSYFSFVDRVPNIQWSYYMPFPHGVNNPHAAPYLRSELEKFKSAVEEWTGTTITNKELDGAIEVYNKNRQLMKEVFELRKSDNPPITGLHAMEMVVSSQIVDKKDHNEVLEALLEELKDAEVEREAGTRLILIGSEDDDRSFLELVEYGINYPATFVYEECCTGARYFWDEVRPNEDRLMALAERYVYRIPCPAKDWATGELIRRRFQHIERVIKDYNVQGAIITQMKFCDPHELDIPALRDLFDKHDVKHLTLELDITQPVGQFRTRVEAFLEALGEEDLFF
jgi:benzoyl-CoA reductase subunit C